jgi:hypothetical protein
MQVVPQLVESYPVLYETGRFISAIESADIGSRPQSIESTYYYYLISGLRNPARNAVSSKLYGGVESNPHNTHSLNT